jgi:uncharacterized protein (TIGR02246 family)
MGYVSVSAIVAVASAIVVSALPHGEVKDDVLAAQRGISEARRTCDAGEMERLVENDMMWFHSDGKMELNRGEFLAYLRDNTTNPLLCGLDEFRVDVQIVRMYGDDTAVLSGDFYFKAKGKPEMAPPEKAMQVFVKRNGRWLLAANQTTKISAPPPSSKGSP